MTGHGPFGSAAEVRALPHVAHALSGHWADPSMNGMRSRLEVILWGALDAAGVTRGDFDRRVIIEVARNPAMCAVVADWVTRAHQAGRDAGTQDTRHGAGDDPEGAGR